MSKDSVNNLLISDRNRETRSSEPGGNNHYENRNKPPSGQPRLCGSLQRLPPNIDSLPPRLKKKYLLEAGLPEDYKFDNIDTAQLSYSNTVPRSKSVRYDQQGYNHHSYQFSYQPKYQQNKGYQSNNHRSLTPPTTKSTRPQSQNEQIPSFISFNEWKTTNYIHTHDETGKFTDGTTNDDVNFDWSEDVLNSQSFPQNIDSQSNVHINYNDYNQHRRRRRNRRLSSLHTQSIIIKS